MTFIPKPRVIHPGLPKNKLGLTIRDYEGAMSTLCAGCGHDSVTAGIIQAFHELDTSISDRCPIGVPRTTNVVVDPNDSAKVWASVEVNGLHRSLDGGETWTALGPLGPSEFHDDVHGPRVRRNVPRVRVGHRSRHELRRRGDEVRAGDAAAR